MHSFYRFIHALIIHIPRKKKKEKKGKAPKNPKCKANRHQSLTNDWSPMKHLHQPNPLAPSHELVHS